MLLKDFPCSPENNICAWITQFLTYGKCTEKLSIILLRFTTNKAYISKEVHILHTVLSNFQGTKINNYVLLSLNQPLGRFSL